MQKISVLGATGSVGTNTLKLLATKLYKYNVIALTANNNYKKLARFAIMFNCKYAVIANKELLPLLMQKLKDTNIKCLAGIENIIKISQLKVDLMVSAIVGIAGLKPTYESIGNSRILAIANKESIISAGTLLINKAKNKNTKIIPLDSEHNAIFQAINNEKAKSIKSIILTASGGPFLKKNMNKFKNISVKDALRHPNWKMGKKITIDSATLMNKLLETIEASILFEIDLEKIKILIHPASIIHGIVNYIDGTTHMIGSNPDMKIPINYALNWPDRAEYNLKNIDLLNSKDLSFLKPDYKKFPSLKLKKIINKGNYKKSIIIVLNAANEVAVEHFLKNKIDFVDIVKIIKKTVKLFNHIKIKSINDVIKVDNEARILTKAIINKKLSKNE